MRLMILLKASNYYFAPFEICTALKSSTSPTALLLSPSLQEMNNKIKICNPTLVRSAIRSCRVLNVIDHLEGSELGKSPTSIP